MALSGLVSMPLGWNAKIEKSVGRLIGLDPTVLNGIGSSGFCIHGVCQQKGLTGQ